MADLEKIDMGKMTDARKEEIRRRWPKGDTGTARLGAEAEGYTKELREQYGTVPSTVNEYSKGIGNTTVANQQGEQLDQDGANLAAVLGNQPKMVAEYFTELAPIARSMTPFFTGAETWSDWWEGQKYVGPIDLPRSMTNTKLSMDDNVGMNGFVKIAKNQKDEEFGQSISGLLGRQIDADTIFNWIAADNPDIKTKADAEKLFNENEDFNAQVNGFLDQIQQSEEGSQYMLYGRDWFQDKDNYYVKNFKNIPGINFAWTNHNDLAMPGLGIYKINDDGSGSMLRASPLSYKGIPGMEQLQEAGLWGQDTSAMGEVGHYKYNMMFDGDNPYTQMYSQIAAVPASIATGNIKNIMHLPSMAKNVSNLKALGKTGVLTTKPTRPVWSKSGKIFGEGESFAPIARQPGMVEETAKSLAGWPVLKGAWQNKKAVGIASIPGLWGAYGPDWP